MSVPTRARQEVETTLEAQDSYVLVTLPDGRTAQLFGNGQLNVTVAGKPYHYRLPTGAEATPVATPTRRRKR